MTPQHQMLAEDARQWLSKRVQESTPPSSLVVALSAWLRLSVFPQIVVDERRADSMAAKGAARRHQDVASVGFYFALLSDDAVAKSTFVDGLYWLKGRANFVSEGVPSGLLVDWTSVLGIVSGVLALNHAERKPFLEWLKQLCEDSKLVRNDNSIHYAVFAYATAQLDATPWQCPDDAADFQAALCAVGDQPRDAVNWETVWRVATTAENCADDIHRCLIRLAALASALQAFGTVNLPDRGSHGGKITNGMNTNKRQALLIKVERIKNLLTSRATGVEPPPGEYELLRTDLLAEPEISGLLPQFVHTCHTVHEFWNFIKPKFKTYDERREFLHEQFELPLTKLAANAITDGESRRAEDGPTEPFSSSQMSNRAGKPDASATEGSLINTAIKLVPSFRWAVGAAALMALAAVVLKSGFNLATLFLVAGVLFVAAMGFIALQWISTLKPESTSRMAGFVAWSFLGFLVIGLGLVLSSAVFDQPWQFRSWIQRKIQGEEITIRSEQSAIETITGFVAGPDGKVDATKLNILIRDVPVDASSWVAKYANQPVSKLEQDLKGRHLPLVPSLRRNVKE